MLEIGETFRFAEHRQIGRCCAKHAATDPQTMSNQTIADPRADPDRDIAAAIEQIGKIVRKVDRQLNLGMMGKKTRQCWHDMHPTERRRGGYAQFAADKRVLPAYAFFCSTKRRAKGQQSLMQLLPDGRQGKAPGRAVDQTRRKTRFEASEPF